MDRPNRYSPRVQRVRPPLPREPASTPTAAPPPCPPPAPSSAARPWGSPVTQSLFGTPTVHSEFYDGPLELLLFIVRRDGIDLRRVSIAPIADAYLAQLKLMQRCNLDVAAEFLVMASTLCWLKSRELLPRTTAPNEDDPTTVRNALTRQLLEYERYRDAARALSARPTLGVDTFARPAEPIATAERPVYADTDAFGLLERFVALVQRTAAPPVAHEVAREEWSLHDAARLLLDQLRQGPRDLSELLHQIPLKSHRVYTFLATLELTRQQVISIDQSDHLGPIRVRALLPPEDADLSLLAESAG